LAAFSNPLYSQQFRFPAKLIALFLRDGQALKDCFESLCRDWRLGNLPELVTQLHFSTATPGTIFTSYNDGRAL
jgi:hypothetical protein